MNRQLAHFGIVVLVITASSTAMAERPAPPPSRYSHSFKIDEKSLPKGVTVRTVGEGKAVRYFIKNSGATPLVINEIFSNDKLVSGAKLENGKVYGWFPSGVPMEGKTHLKGWQAPFGDIEETTFNMPREPAKIVEGRKPGLGKDIPKPEESSIKVNYDGKPLEIKITIQYWLNDEYDNKK